MIHNKKNKKKSNNEKINFKNLSINILNLFIIPKFK